MKNLVKKPSYFICAVVLGASVLGVSACENRAGLRCVQGAVGGTGHPVDKAAPGYRGGRSGVQPAGARAQRAGSDPEEVGGDVGLDARRRGLCRPLQDTNPRGLGRSRGFMFQRVAQAPAE